MSPPHSLSWLVLHLPHNFFSAQAWLNSALGEWQTGWSTGWPVEWQNGWLSGWLVKVFLSPSSLGGWWIFIDVTCLPSGSLPVWLRGLFIGCLICWLFDWLVDWLNNTMVGSVTALFCFYMFKNVQPAGCRLYWLNRWQVDLTERFIVQFATWLVEQLTGSWLVIELTCFNGSLVG